MSRLPSHHIPRLRLTDLCRDERVVVVEAAGGYGKSVLGLELVDVWGAVPVEVLLDQGGVSGQLLAGRLRAAVSRAGFADAAAAMAAVGDDPAGAVDAMLDGLAGEDCAIVIDDAHHATRDAAALIDRIVSRLEDPQRAIVLARNLPAGAERLRRAGTLQLDAAELALRPEETSALCSAGFGLEVTAADVRWLDAVTGGWTAAAVLAASRAKQAKQPLRDVAALSGDRAAGGAVTVILDEVLVAFGSRRSSLAQLAPLPLLDAQVLAVVTGDDGFFDRVVALGLPLTPADGGWWELPGPVRDHLADLGEIDPAAVRRAAIHYEQRGELGAALQMLLGVGDSEAAAEVLSHVSARHLEAADVLELLSVLDRIPTQVLDRHPVAILHVARGCQAAAMLEQRARLLARLPRIVAEREDPALRRAVDVERATDLANDGTAANEAEALARRALEAAGEGEDLTRARALSVIGRAATWRRDGDGRRTVEGLREAAGHLEQAAQLYLALGMPATAAGLAPFRAVMVEMALGRPQVGLEVLDAGLALAVEQPRRFAFVLLFRAEVLIELGRYEDCDADINEVLQIAAQRGDRHLVAYAHWMSMLACSQRGNAERTLLHVRETEANRADWWEVGSADFLADAADCLDRVGHTGLAWDYLARAHDEPRDAGPLIAMAECALLARHGDPVEAEQRLSVVHGKGIAPREYWRVTLLRAAAAFRRGDLGAGGLAARAFEEAARLGQPQLPVVRERELTESLLTLASETGLPAARALAASPPPAALSVLGRFELTRGGLAVPIGPGQSAQLLKLVAVSGGAITSEQAIEALWPDVDPAAGRNRLRTVRARLRNAAGDVLVRDGDSLALADGVQLDLVRFHQTARQTLALGRRDASAVALARSAIAGYRGELLPTDRYEDWARDPREAARSTMLDLLDLCAASAAQRGDLDEARRMVERMIELAPDEDERYLKTAVVLFEHVSKGAALSVLHRARFTLAKLGVDPSSQFLSLERSLAA